MKNQLLNDFLKIAPLPEDKKTYDIFALALSDDEETIFTTAELRLLNDYIKKCVNHFNENPLIWNNKKIPRLS